MSNIALPTGALAAGDGENLVMLKHFGPGKPDAAKSISK